MLNFVLDFLFPPRCSFCGKVNTYLCPKCRYKLNEKAVYKAENYGKYKHIYLFKYEGDIRNKLIDFKFNDKPYIAKSFAKFIIKNEKICGILKKYDIITAVPMYIKKQNKRGYNQAELFAKYLAEELNMKYYQTLEKIKNTKMQSSLNKQEREHNLDGAYKLKNAEIIQNKNIILVDDIYTTGSTVNECIKMLKNANKIIVFTIAKD